MANRLLWWSAGGVAAYCAGSVLLPDRYVSSVASYSLMIFALMTLLRYLPDTYRVVFGSVRDETEKGAHLAVYGNTLLAFGLVYIGAYSAVWNAMGQPASWVGSGVSGFGRAVAAVGCCLIFSSPDVTKFGFGRPARSWMIAVLAVAAVVIFAIGFSMGVYQAAGITPDDVLSGHAL